MHPDVLQNNSYVLVQLTPQLLYHADSSFPDEIEGKNPVKREPVTVTLAVLLGLGVTAGIGTRTTVLVQQPLYYNKFREAIDADLKLLKDFIAKLRYSLISLSEVVLQSRRGLERRLSDREIKREREPPRLVRIMVQ